MLSVIVPVFNEEAAIYISRERISKILETSCIDFEIVYVDDGSKDNSWSVIKDESIKFSYVRGIHFSRNFGKDAAIHAGLNEVRGECAVVIDCDLQHPPEKIVEMYDLWKQGYELVEGVKTHRGKESFLHKMSAKWFYSLISAAAGVDMENASDFKLLDRKVIDVMKHINEKNVFFRAMSSWTGFKKTSVEFEVAERVAGTSKWSSFDLIKYAVKNITSFSTFPMHVVTVLGIITFLCSLIVGCISLYQYFTGTALEGFTTIIILQLFFSSVIMTSIGIVGYYIAKILEEVKDRPSYIISEKCGGETR